MSPPLCEELSHGRTGYRAGISGDFAGADERGKCGCPAHSLQIENVLDRIEIDGRADFPQAGVEVFERELNTFIIHIGETVDDQCGGVLVWVLPALERFYCV